MPEIFTKFRPPLPPTERPKEVPPYAELQATSNFSFLEGGSHPEELISAAHGLGYKAIAITDRLTLAGIVRAHLAATEVGIQLIVGCRLDIAFSSSVKRHSLVSLLVYPTNRESYGNLCRLLTLGKRRAPKGECHLTLEDYLSHRKGFITILLPPRYLRAPDHLEDLHFLEFVKIVMQAGDRDSLSLAITKDYSHRNPQTLRAACDMAQYLGLPIAATGDALYHTPSRRPLQDILTCIRHGTTIQKAGLLLSQNAERYLKPPEEMWRLFREMPGAMRRSLEIAEAVSGFSLSQLKYEYPNEICPPGESALQHLIDLTWEGAKERFPGGVPEKVARLLKEEFQLIHELSYEKYFLTCHDIVRYARSRGILCQGRGAAANSAVCFCLGITSVDPSKIDLLFARFVSKERNEPPDIDIDFEHERREEVIQYIYQKYGRHRAGLTAEVITYRQRSAVREVGKALGLSLEVVDRLAKSVHRWTDNIVTPDDLREIGLNPASTLVQNLFILAKELMGFPRHLSQHVGGFIISSEPLEEMVPILNAGMEDRTIIEWDKDDIEALGMLKIDVLGLGMLTCIRKALSLINQRLLHTHNPRFPLELHTIPAEDSAVYDMICAADTIGVFQIESRAQMSMLPRLKPRCFYDLVIEVAIVRPGPIQGNMVHPYLKRRSGAEKVSFPNERVAEILGKTLGVPLFQEQAMRLAIVLANFTPGEAEQLRRAMAAWKRDKGKIAVFKKRIVEGMLQNGYPLEFAETCMSQIKGFSEYGFPESHAASFALLVYASAWIKKHYPAEFAAGLLNSQPMGFYAPSQIIQDAEAHGVEVRPIDVNYSGWFSSVEVDRETPHERPILRLGMHLVRGLRETQAELINDAVKSYGAFTNIHAFWLHAHQVAQGREPLRKQTLEILARADAFRSLGLTQRKALWEIRALPETLAPLDGGLPVQERHEAQLPLLGIEESVFQDYRATNFSLKGHPISFLRHELNRRQVSTAVALRNLPLHMTKRERLLIKVAGIAIVRQRPGTARGMVFITLEDETGMSNLVIPPDVFEKYQKLVISSSVLLATGTLDRVGEVIYVTTRQLESLDGLILQKREVNFPNRSYSY